MKKVFLAILGFFMWGVSKGQNGIAPVSIHASTYLDANGNDKSFSDFEGKKILIVNTASKCGFTPQYDDLQKLHEQYQEKLVILVFPCNDFGNQEPGSMDEIQSFCKLNYGLSFPVQGKVTIKEDRMEPYLWLTDPNQNGWNDKAPKWNFFKYLIDEKGNLVAVHPSNVNPMSKKITDWLND